MYAIVKNDVVVKSGSLAALFPNISFPPDGPESHWLAENDVQLIISEISFDPATQRIEYVDPYIANGLVYSVKAINKSDEQIANERHNHIIHAIQSMDMSISASMTNAEKDHYTELALRVVRDYRNNKLSESDWTALVDCTLPDEKKADWASYRQALRDITTQTDPFNITWPTKPE